MELKKRIEFIMEKEQLTAAIFADMIGVQRSSISHILSERNKPSLEFLQKILNSFPKYNTNWLVMGKGNPLATMDKTQAENQTYIQEKATLPDLFTDVNEKSYIKKEIIPLKNEEKREMEQEKIDIRKEKEIEQIIVCYTDKTFLSYKPSEI